MRTRVALATAAALALAASPASARTVDYTLSEEDFRAAAAAIGAPAPAAAPSRGTVQVVVENEQALDHQLAILGIHCSAWRVDNPLSEMVRRSVAAWDSDGSLEPVAGAPLLRVTIGSASSTLRCVEVQELQSRCMVRTRIAGEAKLQRPGSVDRTVPFSVQDEQIHDRPVSCGTLSRGTALSGRAASFALIERLRALAEAE